MADAGINFRVTSGYVTDGTNDTYCLAATDGSTCDEYPTTRGGVTFGWEDNGEANPNGRDRNNGVDARLAGMHFIIGSDVFTYDFRLDKTGSLKVDVGFGDEASAAGGVTCSIRDSGGEKFAVADATLGAAEFLDATDAKRTSVADWVNNHTQSAAYTFADYTRFRFGPTGTVNQNRVAHVKVFEQSVTTVGCLTQGGLKHPRLVRGRLVA